MFSKKKKKPQISCPTNFEHRVHTGFDKREGRYIGLPLQWASIVGNNQILKSTNRPLPLVDPSEITPTEILDLKTIVRGDHKSENRLSMHQIKSNNSNGIVLPKTSNVARSNSLRSSSPPRLRRDNRHNNTNVPPAVPEEQILQYPSMRRDPSISKPQVRESSPAERSISNHEIQNMQVNGNVQETFATYQQAPREATQISPAGSITSVPAIIPQHQGNHLPSGPPPSVTQSGYSARPDQNQNVKNGSTVNPSTTTTTSSSGKHHEQRLTHEQYFLYTLHIFTNLCSDA
ncbi:hypothetical protein AMK59_2414 [Oryctes borbonicus]|uniref:non-specific serine/threonine protein kinase n=1 Tax=Oryctes borbonicus TaxID=1629725 RepID=A0A0T6BE40_9SCAR|nr:hypothetical protein AMK59_2414 [Oryctes borbonicus]